MVTLDQIAHRLGWKGKDRMRRVRRMLDHIGRDTGTSLYKDFGPEARPRYWIDNVTLTKVFPALAGNYPSLGEIADARDGRLSELHADLEGLREALLKVTRRVSELERRRF